MMFCSFFKVSTLSVPIPAIWFESVSGVKIPMCCIPKSERVSIVFAGRLHCVLSLVHCCMACIASTTFLVFWMSFCSSGPMRCSSLFR